MADATARDLSRKLGISAAAVSMVLNGKPGVSSDTRQKVLAAAFIHSLKGFDDV